MCLLVYFITAIAVTHALRNWAGANAIFLKAQMDSLFLFFVLQMNKEAFMSARNISNFSGVVIEVTVGAFTEIENQFDVFKRNDVSNEFILDAGSLDDEADVTLIELLGISENDWDVLSGLILVYHEGKSSFDEIVEQSESNLQERHSDKPLQFAVNNGLKGEINVGGNNDHGIAINFHGYSDFCSQDHNGTPVYIEKYDNELRLVVYGDINQEDPTDIISLEGANVDKRKKV